MKKIYIMFFVVLFNAHAAIADVASVDYVKSTVSTRVSTEQSAEQTLQGNYTVSGTLDVETPTLPFEIE